MHVCVLKWPSLPTPPPSPLPLTSKGWGGRVRTQNWPMGWVYRQECQDCLAFKFVASQICTFGPCSQQVLFGQQGFFWVMFSTGSFWTKVILLGHVLNRIFLGNNDSFGSYYPKVLFEQQWLLWVIFFIQVLFEQQWLFWVMFSTGSFWATVIILGHVLYRFFLGNSDSFGSCFLQVLFEKQWFFARQDEVLYSLSWGFYSLTLSTVLAAVTDERTRTWDRSDFFAHRLKLL